MSDTKHTPGPWHVDQIDQSTIQIKAAGVIVAEVCSGSTFTRLSDEQQANARLIAAAPDLLDELRKAHQIIRNALAVMTTEQKSKWGRLNERDAVDGEGITRANERQSVIVRAEAFHA